jgi:hypothetical protein
MDAVVVLPTRRCTCNGEGDTEFESSAFSPSFFRRGSNLNQIVANNYMSQAANDHTLAASVMDTLVKDKEDSSDDDLPDLETPSGAMLRTAFPPTLTAIFALVISSTFPAAN